MYRIAISERLRQDTLSKKETFIGYLEIVEQMDKHIHMYVETSQNGTLAKNTNIYVNWWNVSVKQHRIEHLVDNRKETKEKKR